MFAVDDRVQWFSSNSRKEGVVVEVVPAGAKPLRMDPDKVGQPRDHESYVIKGGERGAREQIYWPRTSLLQRAGSLSAVEVAWCHEHAEAVRSLMTRMANS